MDRIWAPWRMKYISGEHKDEGCIFCIKPKEDDDRKNLILYRGNYSFIMMNLFPYNNGHLMVAPYRHVADLEALNNDEVLDMMNLVKKGIKAIKRSMRPDGFNTGFNLGRAAGAGIEMHLHFHIVPRWIGDTNFMPTLAATKVISEHILDTYDKLYKELYSEEI